MSAREAAPTPTHSWDMLLDRCRAQRLDIRTGLSPPFSRVSLVRTSEGCRMYALGTAMTQPNQTLLSVDILPGSSGNLSLQPVLDSDSVKTSMPNQEFSLLCERQRMSVVSGVTDYSINPHTRTALITAGGQLLKLSEGSSHPSCVVDGNGSGSTAFVFDAKICPSNPSIVSYIANKQVHIKVDDGLSYSTTSFCDDIHNGVPSFIAQEELDRFEGTWWSPTEPRLLYEQIDDSKVKSLNFSGPGKESASLMKYPLAGSANSTSVLRMLVVENNKVHDIGLKKPLNVQFPWIEYIARAGFMNDGKTVWVQVLDREQLRCALIVLPECEFEGVEANESCPVEEATVIFEETTEAWINTHNTIIPMDTPRSHDLPFVYLSECESQAHLFLVGIEVNTARERVKIYAYKITSGDHSVCKATGAVWDRERKLLYYVAAPTTPTEWAVCVADLSDKDNFTTRQLTPANMSFRSERSYHVLSVVPGMGFACWMTSLSQPPVCHYYSIKFTGDSRLPNAVLSVVVGVGNIAQMQSATTDINLPKFFYYTSKNSGFQHVAMLITPKEYEHDKKYPVLHYVYGGPGIQLVKNDYAAWVPFQKYTRLGYAVVVVDGRGSSNRGRKFEESIKYNMGGPEVEDQLEGLHEVARLSNGLLDLQRVVVHGWSYGGYLALMMLAKYPEVYRGSIAGGAVVDWKLYDTAYTERYLGYPVKKCYEECSVPRFIETLPTKPGRLLIVHGFMDENVHFRHTEVLIDALLKHGKPYQLQVFPQERHGIRSTESAAHLDATMLYFIQQALSQ